MSVRWAGVEVGGVGDVGWRHSWIGAADRKSGAFHWWSYLISHRCRVQSMDMKQTKYRHTKYIFYALGGDFIRPWTGVSLRRKMCRLTDQQWLLDFRRIHIYPFKLEKRPMITPISAMTHKSNRNRPRQNKESKLWRTTKKRAVEKLFHGVCASDWP